jgi:hypothetical protein
MCGVVAELILLSVAIAKTGDQAQVESKGGRVRIENAIPGQKSGDLQREFRSSLKVLKYLRDISAHARPPASTTPEAFTSLAIVLRFAQFATNRWSELTI